jgi:hypothetical protein
MQQNEWRPVALRPFQSLWEAPYDRLLAQPLVYQTVASHGYNPFIREETYMKFKKVCNFTEV